jgi:NADH:ubiquinone oxidoreductase subunit 3 (subunit A)
MRVSYYQQILLLVMLILIIVLILPLMALDIASLNLTSFLDLILYIRPSLLL